MTSTLSAPSHSTVPARQIGLTREGNHFRLAFPYDPDLVKRMQYLPWANFDREGTKTWTTLVCIQSVDRLRRMHHEGLTDTAVDDLLDNDEELLDCPPAELRSGSKGRPFVLATAWQDETLSTKIRAIPTVSFDKRQMAYTFAPSAAAALFELVERGAVADPDRVLAAAQLPISFDIRSGRFRVFGADPRAEAAFQKRFPETDVVQRWEDKGHEVAFTDELSAEVYQSELGRAAHALYQPEGLKLDLYEYQQHSVALALSRSGFGVFHSPGLGKTAIGVAVGHELVVNRAEATRAVVICPGAVRTTWADEISRFTGDDNVVVVAGDKKKRDIAYEEGKSANWVVVNYDVLHRDAVKLAPLFKGASVIVDEAHRLKNNQAKRTKAAHKLARHSVHRLVLTGTPVETKPEEWFWVMHFAVPGCLGSSKDFCPRYMYKGQFGYEGARNLDELRVRSAAHFIRYRKADVATHLPPLVVKHVPLVPDTKYAALLRRVHSEATDEIASARLESSNVTGAELVLDGYHNAEVATGAEMTSTGMLRLLCTSPRLLWRSESQAAQALCEAGLVPDVDGPKLDELRILTSELAAADERVVIFSGSKKMVELISERFTEDAIEFVTFTGDTSHADRDIARRRFTDPDDPVTAFIATDAAAEGLNLGRCCSTLVNVDVPWTPTRIEQRSNRIHRIDGQADSYLVINMTLQGTLEEGILRLVEQRADVADSIFGDAGSAERTTGRRRRGGWSTSSFLSEAMSMVDIAMSSKPAKSRRTKPKVIAPENQVTNTPPKKRRVPLTLPFD